MEASRVTLAELQDIIDNTLKKELNRHFWVTAEIAELKENYSGHCYLELVDKNDGDETIRARLKGIIWSRQARFLLPYFKTTAGIDLDEGLSVLLKGKIEYHPIYGLSLVITDIDPKYTIGDLAKKRIDIINRLTSEGVVDMNGQLDLPLLPSRIAVISSNEAAGFEDFKNQLLFNSYGYHYSIELFTAVLQGTTTSSSVISAFNRISKNIGQYDLLVIVRGGGSSSDLSWFDDYDIAFMISQFPLPVITGIGHDRDLTVTDLVSHSSCKTPTAAADFIIGLSQDTENYLLSLGRSITSASVEKVNSIKNDLGRLSDSIINSSRLDIISSRQKNTIRKEIIASSLKHYISSVHSRLSSVETRVITQPGKFLEGRKEKIKGLERTVANLDPLSVLKRGYSITLNRGKPILQSDQVEIGQSVTTILYDGRFESDVFEIKE